MSREISRKNMLDCARRELKRRVTRYPGMVREGRLNPHVADCETKAMEAIVASLEMLLMLEEISLEMIAAAEAEKACLRSATDLSLGNDALPA